MLQAIAIDDEPIALEIIKNLSAQVPFLELGACFTNALEASGYLQKNKPDLIFLDIKMPDLSGMELIRTLAHPPMVIFTTAYSEHAVQGFELDAIDYLLKPFSLARFLKACNKAYEQQSLRSHELPSGAVFIKSGYEQVRVELADIMYAESMGNYIRFVLSGQVIVSRLTMNEAESLLPGAGFIRIHRSYLVAKEKITKIDKHSVWVGETELPTSSAYNREIEQLTAGRQIK